MHQLGYELPERTGFGGIWDAVSEDVDRAHPTAGEITSIPMVVAHSQGAASATTRRTIEAFRRICCDVETDDEAA